MNKNTFMSPLRGLALASVATAVLSSCAKDEFTERQALGLELQKLRAQREVDSLARVQQRIYDINTLRYQRALDSLDRINAGGRVFYSVAVVSGSSAAFSSGRSEEVEGVAGATVSISQYGAVTTVTTPASGLATAELRSGAAAVVISAPNHTTVNYVVNLTPDGSTQIGTPGNVIRNAPGNGTTVYVSNVMPLFQTGGANAATQMGTVRGLALIETNLTNDVPEIVTPALLGTGTNLLTANIDVNAAFMARYINNRANNSTTIPTNAGTNGWEGDVQRVVYETATSVATLDATGAYSVLVPATASGLPIRLKYSDIATNRTWWAGRFDGIDHNAVINRRFIYGPNVTAPTGGIVVGNMPGQVRLTQTLSVVTSEATGTVTVNPSTTATRTVTIGANTYFVLNPNGATPAEQAAPAPGNAGQYLANDAISNNVTVTFPAAPAGGTTAVGSVELGAADPVTNLRGVIGIRVVTNGTGYTDTSIPATFVRGDAPGVTGRALQQAPSDRLGSIQVIDGGFGFRNPSLTSPGAWTGSFPTILFNGQAALIAPVVTPTVTYVVDGTPLGTISRIDLATPGDRITAAPTITFDYGNGAAIPVEDNTGDDVFVLGAGGALEFNSNYGTSGFPAPNLMTLTGVGAVNGVNGLSGGSSPYVFVPTASISFTAASAGTGATLAATVSATTGLITTVALTGGTGYTAADIAPSNIRINFSRPTNSLSAVAYLAGTGLDNYVFDSNQLTGTFVETFNSGGVNARPTPAFTATNKVSVAAQNNYIAVFSRPQSAPFTPAQGVPVFDTRGRVVGLEITNPGAGYTGPATFALQVAGTTANTTAGNASGSVPVITLPRTLSIATTGGTGYALPPQAYFTGGGIPLGSQPVVNAELRFGVPTAAALAGAVPAAPANAIIWMDASTGNVLGFRYAGAFPWGTAATITADPIRIIFSAENHRINIERAYTAFLDQISTSANAGIIYAVPGPNGSIRAIQMVRASSTFPGDIEEYLNGHVTTLDTVEWHTRTLPSPYFNTTRFITAPRITFQGTGATPGTGLTGAFVLGGSAQAAPQEAPMNAGGLIRNLRVITGGSGYVSGPVTFNSRTVGRATDNNTNLFGYASTYTINYATLRTNPNFYLQVRTGVPFTAVGVGTENGNAFNLEAFSGITYVRDIHYGTGVYVDN